MNAFWALVTAVQMPIVLIQCRATPVCVGVGLLGMGGPVQYSCNGDVQVIGRDNSYFSLQRVFSS